jgi:hypothetical protein
MNRNNIYRLKLRALREEFAERAKHDNRRAKLIENAERAEAQAELKRVSLTRNTPKCINHGQKFSVL